MDKIKREQIEHLFLSPNIVPEPLFASDDRRTYVPTNRQIFLSDVHQMTETLGKDFWIALAIPYNDASDKKDWNGLTQNEQHFVKMVLAFFAQSDAVVNENLAEVMMKFVKNIEVQHFYKRQIANEDVHSQTYSLLIEAIERDEIKKNELLEAYNNFDVVRKKMDWALKYIYDHDIADEEDMMLKSFKFGTNLIAFACVEGIFFSGSFCALFWLKYIKKSMTQGLGLANEYIARDEAVHFKFAAMLYKTHFKNKFKKSYIQKIIEEAVSLEKEFILGAIPVSMIGMSSELMSQYIEYVSDVVCDEFEVPRIFNRENPFPFMTNIGISKSSNFFEKKVSEYQKTNIKSENDNDF